MNRALYNRTPGALDDYAKDQIDEEMDALVDALDNLADQTGLVRDSSIADARDQLMNGRGEDAIVALANAAEFVLNAKTNGQVSEMALNLFAKNLRNTRALILWNLGRMNEDRWF